MVAAMLFLGLLGVLGGWTTFSTFSGTTTNEGNQLVAGTVRLDSSSVPMPMYDVSGQVPGSSLERCIRITTTGSLPARVRLYGSPVGPAGGHVSLVVTRVTGVANPPSCVGFTEEGPPLFSGTLAGFAAAHRGWPTGIPLPSPSGGAWVQGTAATYRFRLEQTSSPAAEGLSTGPHAFTWEARNL